MVITDILTKIFVEVDDFSKAYEQEIAKSRLTDVSNRRKRSSRLSDSELVTIVIAFHQTQLSRFSISDRILLIRLRERPTSFA
jgi:hypothetical protein